MDCTRFFLFNARPLRYAEGLNINSSNGAISIATAYQPEKFVVCDILFLTTPPLNENDDNHQITIAMIEETPKILDPQLDYETINVFEEMIEYEQFLTIVLSPESTKQILINAMDLGQQLIAH
jgi:hypothetical protein